jgi:hypothetical protein
MRNALVLLVALALVPACSKDKSKDSGGGGGGGKGGATVKVDKAKLGIECKSDMDCGMLDFNATCRMSCKQEGDAPGYCQLTTFTSTAGTKGCWGNRRGAGDSGTSPSDKTPLVYYCDMDAGVYCAMDTHECVAAKAIGADCKDSDECGKDGVCQANKCVAAGAPGAAPVEGRCASAAYKKDDQCIARVANGGACEESDQCQSLTCEYGEKKQCVASNDKACEL